MPPQLCAFQVPSTPRARTCPDSLGQCHFIVPASVSWSGTLLPIAIANQRVLHHYCKVPRVTYHGQTIRCSWANHDATVWTDWEGGVLRRGCGPTGSLFPIRSLIMLCLWSVGVHVSSDESERAGILPPLQACTAFRVRPMRFFLLRCFR